MNAKQEPMEDWGLCECDGCGFQGTYEEVDKHVKDVNTLPNGELNDIKDVVCWGVMQVGSGAWKDLHEKGIHPMTKIVQDVELAAMTHGINLYKNEPPKEL